MKSGGEGEIGAACAQARDHVEIIFARMPAVHRRQNAVGAGLHRQVHIRHQRGEVAMGGDQVVVHVARVAGHVAQARDAGHLVETAQQPAERRRTPVAILPMIGIHVLPDQCHLAHAGSGQAFDFGDDFLHRARDFHATRVGHNAKRAELVTAFLHRDEGGNAALGDCFRSRRGERIELVVRRKFGIDDLLTRLHAREQAGQPVIILRADHQINRAGAPDDFFALSLRHATGDCDQHGAAKRCGLLLQLADAADLGIEFIDRLFADVAGVEDDQVGVVDARGLAVAGRRQSVRHTMGIVDVHLAAEGLDVDFTGSAHAARVRTGWPI